MSNVFLISDTHFFHKSIVVFEHEARPFDSVEEMNESMVERWNSVVTKRDVVIHLGDVCFGGQANLEIMSRLNGSKRLIRGNHDCYNTSVYLKYFKEVEACRKYDGHMLTHIPIHPDEMYRFTANVHGHLHSRRVLINGQVDTRYINASCEHHNLTPVPWEVLKKEHQ